MNNYSEEQKQDIKARYDKCIAFLAENKMTPAAMIQKIKLDLEGKDIFADQITCYLNNTKIFDDGEDEIVSPLSDEMTKNDTNTQA